MRQVTVDVYDCKADSERPEQFTELVTIKYGNKEYKAVYQVWGDGTELWNAKGIKGFINFTDADEWYRPISGSQKEE